MLPNYNPDRHFMVGEKVRPVYDPYEDTWAEVLEVSDTCGCGCGCDGGYLKVRHCDGTEMWEIDSCYYHEGESEPEYRIIYEKPSEKEGKEDNDGVG